MLFVNRDLRLAKNQQTLAEIVIIFFGLNRKI